jgi:PASTA domain
MVTIAPGASQRAAVRPRLLGWVAVILAALALAFSVGAWTSSRSAASPGAVTGPVYNPDLVGRTVKDVEKTLPAIGLKVGSVTYRDAQASPPGTVVRQSPAAGTKLAVGSVVNLVVSDGPGTPPASCLVAHPATPCAIEQ